MTFRSPTSIDNMLSRIPVPVRAALEAEFRLQVRTAYTKHLNDKLAAFNASVTQAALPLLPATIPKITPFETAEATTEIPGFIQGKLKASGTPTRSPQNIANPVATISATADTTTAATGTSTANALQMLDSDSDDTNERIPPPVFPKKEHELTIIRGMDIKNHLEFIKSDISIIVVKTEPGTSNTTYVNGIHFFATVLAITEALVAAMDLLPHIKNIGNRKDVRTNKIIGFLTTNGVKLTPLTNDYETIMKTDHASSIIIKYAVMLHPFKSTDLPASWLQFSLLLKKEKLLVPFNQRGCAINLGNQFNEQKWTRDFTHYYKHNLNYKIAPVNRADKKG
jgi:hypothetical protein